MARDDVVELALANTPRAGGKSKINEAKSAEWEVVDEFAVVIVTIGVDSVVQMAMNGGVGLKLTENGRHVPLDCFSFFGHGCIAFDSAPVNLTMRNQNDFLGFLVGYFRNRRGIDGTVEGPNNEDFILGFDSADFVEVENLVI